jgi:hypothetical protein
MERAVRHVSWPRTSSKREQRHRMGDRVGLPKRLRGRNDARARCSALMTRKMGPLTPGWSIAILGLNRSAVLHGPCCSRQSTFRLAPSERFPLE